MQSGKMLSVLSVIAGVASGCAAEMGSADMSAPAKLRETALGLVLTDTSGMTLYIHKGDPAGKSVCNGRCARKWPPLQAPPNAEPTGNWSVITRQDGTQQ